NQARGSMPVQVEQLHRVIDIYSDIEPERLVEWQPTPAAWIAVSSNPIVECFTIDQLHDESRGDSRLFDPEKRGDVGMNDRREYERFLLEAGKAVRVERVSVWQDLQTHIA